MSLRSLDALFIMVPLIFITVWCVVNLIHIEIVHRKIMKLLCAVHSYRLDCIANDTKPVIEWTDLDGTGSYYDTLRVWRIEHMLPPDKYAVLEPYLNRKAEK